MCSVQEEGVTAPDDRPKICGKACMKCGEAAVVVIRGSDPMCKACFVGYCTHKFRAAFGKSRIVRDGEDALVAFSGGINSSAMLHLIQVGKSPRANRKLRFTASLVYIDEGCVLDVPVSEQEAHTNNVIDLMVKSGLPWCTYKLEQALDPSLCGGAQTEGAGQSEGDAAPAMSDLEAQMSHLQIGTQYRDKLLHLVNQAKTLTAKDNLIHTLRTKLLVAVARQRGFAKLLLSDSSTRLAVRMLSDISQGRGAHVALQMSFADHRHGDVTIVRPMREFVAKEAAMLLSLNRVQSFVAPTITTMSSAQASIDRLTEEFVAGLQAAHPRTVPTVFRTGEKMDIDLTDGITTDRCAFCMAPLDTDVGESSALSATLFSQSLCSSSKSTSASISASSTNSTSASTSSQSTSTCSSANSTSACSSSKAGEDSCCGQGDGSCQSSKTSVNATDVQKVLCYGCRLVVKDMGDVAALPEVVLEAAGRAARRNQMKETIQDFLLNDEDQ